MELAKNIKLSTKQSIGFGIILITLAGVNFYTIEKMGDIKAEIDEVTTNWLPRAITISEINRNTSNLRINQLQHALAPDDSSKQHRIDNIIALIDSINANLDTYEKLKQESDAQNLYSPDELALFNAFDQKWEEYQDLSFEFFQLVRENRNRRAIALLNGPAAVVFKAFSQSLIDLVEVNKRDSFAAARRAEATFYRTRSVFRVLFAVTVLLSILMAIALVRLVTVPVRRLEQAVGKIAQGDLETRVAVTANDEIGSLAKSFNKMTISLRKAQQKTQLQAKRLEKQNSDLERAMVELRNSQEQLLMKEKMAALGNLVAGVAHEINNPIGTVSASADVANRCLKRVEKMLQDQRIPPDLREQTDLTRTLRIMHESVRVILLAGERITTIIRSLKNFARLDESEFQKANIHEGIESSLTLLHKEFENRVTVAREYGKLPQILCYPGQLNQVFLNLLKNASDAIAETGTINIRTLQENEHVCIEISDTGRGIPPERLEKLFDFGFTVGGERIKMTSGLSTSYNIIQKHNGEIKVKSEVGKGTTFAIILPLKRPT